MENSVVALPALPSAELLVPGVLPTVVLPIIDEDEDEVEVDDDDDDDEEEDEDDEVGGAW